MYRSFTLLALFVSLFLIVDQASSAKMKSTWKDPSATASSLQFKKVLVMATIKQPFTRKIAEDKVVQIIKAGGTTDAVPSYTIIGEGEWEDKDAARAKIEPMGFDGAIILKYAGSQDETKYDDNAKDADRLWDPYGDFWIGYVSAWGGVYNALSPNDLTVYIETMFYSFKEGKLIWSGITSVKNPKNAADVVSDIAEETTKYLQKQGLLTKKK